MRKLIKKIAFPFLNRWYQSKTKRTNSYSNHGLTISVLPGVFHPGIFLSTNIFIEFLKHAELNQKRVLELGAGSGMISFFCATQGSIVTATDINENALKGLELNAANNQLPVTAIKSDLFANVQPDDFDIIIINPPYYPKNPKSEQEQAFFCGEDHEYFRRLFAELDSKWTKSEIDIFMILSEDCKIDLIKEIGLANSFRFDCVHETIKKQEKNFIFKIARNG